MSRRPFPSPLGTTESGKEDCVFVWAVVSRTGGCVIQLEFRHDVRDCHWQNAGAARRAAPLPGTPVLDSIATKSYSQCKAAFGRL